MPAGHPTGASCPDSRAVQRRKLAEASLEDRPMYFVSSNTHSLVNLVSASAGEGAGSRWCGPSTSMSNRISGRSLLAGATVAFIARHESGWPDVSDTALTTSLDRWLAP